jgi:hypothetical protein
VAAEHPQPGARDRGRGRASNVLGRLKKYKRNIGIRPKTACLWSLESYWQQDIQIALMPVAQGET